MPKQNDDTLNTAAMPPVNEYTMNTVAMPPVNDDTMNTAAMPPVNDDTPNTATMPKDNDNSLNTAAMPPVNDDIMNTAAMPPVNDDTLNTATMPPVNDDTLNTVTMARKEREKYGQWEVELSYGGDADLHKHFTGCKKNPGHEKFIPVDQFNMKHLPPGYQDNHMVELVKTISDLTVRVSVMFVSDNRPEIVSGIGKPYPCYKTSGSDLMRVGSGLVSDVNIFSNGKKKCDCEECMNSTEPRTIFAYIRIRTAAQVVYDKLEAAKTTCHLFFDRGDTPDACSGVVTLSGATPVWIVPEADWCDLHYVTHDQVLINKLRPMVDHLRKFGLVIGKKYPTGMPPEGSCVPGQFLTIIVSHPHGHSKHVSIGYTSDQNGVKDVNRFCLYRANYLYTTATCAGSSGAHVWVCDGGSVKYPYWAPHSGIWDKELNYCTNYSCFNNVAKDRG